jgi:Flp pilus assembly protein TadG
MARPMLKRIGRALLHRRRGLLRNDSGVTAIEFGLLALPFFSIIGAILETSVVFLSGQILESAVQDAGRLVRTGQAQQAGFDTDRFRERICQQTYGLFGDCSGIFVRVTPVTDFASATVTPPVDWSCEEECDWTEEQVFQAGQGSTIVIVEAYYKWPVILTLGSLGLDDLPNGKRLLGSATVFRNEPFT